MVAVKKVGYHTIYLEEGEYIEPEPHGLIFGLVISTVFWVWAVVNMPGASSMNPVVIIIAYTVLTILSGCMISLILALAKISVLIVPYFKVNSGNAGAITIVKTTSSEDTKAVCRAIKEIESRLAEYDAKEDQLAHIAKRCQ